MQDTSTEKLAFSTEKQTALLGHMLFNDKFYKETHSLVKPSWFSAAFLENIWDITITFHALYGRKPSEEELVTSPRFCREEEAVRKRMSYILQDAKTQMEAFGLDVLQNELTEWVRTLLFKQTVSESLDLYNRKQYEQAFTKLKMGSQSIDLTTFNTSNIEDFLDIDAFFQEQKTELGDACTFGVQAIDQCLVPGNVSGGLLKGDMTILLGGTNAGKSTCMVTVAKHNVMARKKVLYLTHEGRKNDIKLKIWCSMLNCTRPDFWKMYENNAKVMRHVAETYINPYFHYVPMPKPGLRVEEVKAEIYRLQEREMAKSGHGYDLLVDDYPSKLTCAEAAQGHLPLREKERLVYDYFNLMALDLKVHCLTAIQANREGAKISMGVKGSENRLLTPEDAAESYGPSQVATNMLSINRDAVAESRNRVTYYLGKSRSGEKGWAFVCNSSYATCVTHSDHLGAMAYRGMSTMSDKVDALLKEYNGQTLPEHLND